MFKINRLVEVYFLNIYIFFEFAIKNIPSTEAKLFKKNLLFYNIEDLKILNQMIFLQAMGKKGRLYMLFRECNSIILIMILFWATISSPFIFRAQQKQMNPYHHAISFPIDNNLLSNTIEEETPATFYEECMLHENLHSFPNINVSQFFNDHQQPIYISFHGELISPPPEA